jgi:hypothetical protein
MGLDERCGVYRYEGVGRASAGRAETRKKGQAMTAPPVLSSLLTMSESAAAELKNARGFDYEQAIKNPLTLLGALVVACDELDAQRAEVARLTAALKSIADSSCCGCCQEAALFAKAALTGPSPQTGSPLGVV